MKNMRPKNPFFLAPMAGYTDRAFRELCAEYGAGLVMTDLISADRIVRMSKEELSDLFSEKYPHTKFSIQIFGSDIKTMTEAAKIAEKYCDLVDINMGCPSANIIQQGAGSAWLKDPKKIDKLLTSLSNNLNHKFSIKIRAGFKPNKLVHKEIANISEKYKDKLFMITLHARTTDQGYSGEADWNWIREMVQLTDVPICGNGDVKDAEDAREMMKQTGCKYVMVGRYARGDPFIFRKLGGQRTKADSVVALKKYIKKAEKYNIKFSIIKNNTMGFVAGTDKAKQIKEKIVKIKNIEQLKTFLKNS